MKVGQVDWRRKGVVYEGIERIMCSGDTEQGLETSAIGTAAAHDADLVLFRSQTLGVEAFSFYAIHGQSRRDGEAN